jgi:oligoribonuclease NrnB/cAMP/cGMP phosphodiesterase (DHH superfamily)
MTAALAAWLALGDSASYHPMKYGGEKPLLADGDTVYFVDFSWPRQELLALSAYCNVVVLDHHKTAEADLAGFPNALTALWDDNPNLPMTNFDMTKSGAVLAWEFFHPEEPIPTMMLFVQDRDLWLWKYANTKAFSAYLSTKPMTLEAYRGVHLLLEAGAVDDIISIGNSLLELEAQYIKRLCDKAFLAIIDGYDCMVVNAPILQSECCEELLRRYAGYNFSAAFTREADMTTWSLRSKKDGPFDVSTIAAKFGGGGHSSAAGFKLVEEGNISIHVDYSQERKANVHKD